MVSPVKEAVAYTPITEEVQKAVIEQITKTSIASLADVFMVLMASQALKPLEFVERHITPRQKELSEVDTRIHRFMEKMVETVNVQIDNLPGTGMSNGFALLAETTGNPKVRDDLIKSIALDRIKLLVEEFDKINPDIIDKIIKPEPAT